MKYDPDDTGILSLDVGIRLEKLREIHGMGQEEMADVAGLEQSGYSRIENGQRLLKPEHAIDFAERCQVTVDWIYRGITMGLSDYVIEKLVDIRPKFRAALPSKILQYKEWKEEKDAKQSKVLAVDKI